MEMTKKSRKVRGIITQLNKLQKRADELDLVLGNGGEVGSLIGSIADELQVKLEDGGFDR